jgi:hypothetical protein
MSHTFPVIDVFGNKYYPVYKDEDGRLDLQATLRKNGNNSMNSLIELFVWLLVVFIIIVLQFHQLAIVVPNLFYDTPQL